MKEKTEILSTLKKYNFFAECIIEGFRLVDFGTTFEVQMNYVWDEFGNLRQNLSEVKLVCLRFKLVQRLIINNALNQTMRENPENLNWGLNEIAMIKLDEENSVQSIQEYFPRSFNVLTFVWENDRFIKVVFSEFFIIEPPNQQNF